MQIFEKKAKYFKFFEDSKIVEIDQQNRRIAIIFFGKENIIHIFDATPYLEYLPIEEISYDSKIDENLSKEEEKEDLLEIFHKLDLANTKSSNAELGKTIIVDNQEFIKFNNLNLYFEAEKHKNSQNSITQNKSHSIKLNSKSNININLKSKYNQKQIKFSLHKPKIKNKLLSVINCPSNIIIGIKWLNINQPQTSNGQEKNQIKQLIAVFDDGNVHIYLLKSQNYEVVTKVNLTKLQYIPFESYPEQWKIAGQVYTGKPIRDFYISSKSNRLYTLHTDNYIIMWIITFIGNKLSLIANYAINITPDLPVNKILVDGNDKFIFTFHNQSFQIFKINEKVPFQMLYTKKFDEIILKDLCMSKNRNHKENESNGNHKENVNKIDEITPIKKVDENFIDDNESYAIFFNDIIDLSEDLKIYDINFFFNVQKPEFSLFEDYIIFPVYLIKPKKYVLLKFLLKEFMEKITDFHYYEKCVKGENNELIRILKVSYSPIVFGLSPFCYYKDDEISEGYRNNENDSGCVLDIPRNTLHIANLVYQPIALINEGFLTFVNLKNNSLIFEYELFNKKIINPENLIVSWTVNNTILISSTKVMMNVIKYCNEEDILGIPINPNKIVDLFSS